MFEDEGGSILFAKQEIWNALRDIGYEGPLDKLTFQKAMVSPHWKFLIHVLLHCSSPKSTAWDQFGHAIASAFIGLITNQSFNFSYMILDGMITHIKAGSPFLMYPRFVQFLLENPLDGIQKPQDYVPTIRMPPKVFTFMSNKGVNFLGTNTPLNAYMLEVAQAVRDDIDNSGSANSNDADQPDPSEHSASVHTPTPPIVSP